MAKKVPLQPENFELETNTVWAFPNRGKWATHDAKYRAIGRLSFQETLF